MLFAGPGAGGDPTATAVLGDVIDAARELLSKATATPRIKVESGAVVDFGEIDVRWCLRLDVTDSPGVLAKIASAFGDAGVSIRSVHQEGTGGRATLLIVTHGASEASQQEALASLDALDVVIDVASVIRVEG